MKLIKKATKPEPQTRLPVEIGDQVLVQPPANHDGRGVWDLPPKLDMTVVKVNRFTFDAEDTAGNVYRLDIREDQFQVASTKAA